MGRRGPPRPPVELQVLKGERKDRVNPNPPAALDGDLEPPEEMSEAALEVWHYTLEQLAPMRIAKPADRDALVAYCEAVALHRRATELLAQSDVLIKGQKGNVVRNPLVQLQRDAAALIRAFAGEFGLTPRARSEFRTPGGADGDASRKERLLS